MVSSVLLQSPWGRGQGHSSSLSSEHSLPTPNPCAETSAGLKGHGSSFLVKAAFPDRERHQAGLVRGIHVPLPRVWCVCTGPLSSLTSVHTALGGLKRHVQGLVPAELLKGAFGGHLSP